MNIVVRDFLKENRGTLLITLVGLALVIGLSLYVGSAMHPSDDAGAIQAQAHSTAAGV